MGDGIIQKVFDRKTSPLGDYWSSFAIEELKHELVLELAKELESYPSGKSVEIDTFRKWLIGDN
jgi:hypothetical protein